MFYGAAKANWGEPRIAKMEGNLKCYTAIHGYTGTYDIAKHYGSVRRAFGDQVGENDMWIVAAALAHQMPVVTKNLKHFEPMSYRLGFGLTHPDRP